MPPAARVTDMHTCPMVTGVVPHVGGPILPPGHPITLIGSLPAARVGDLVTCAGPPDTIVKGSPTVLIGNMPAARMGDNTAHGGVIVMGHPTTLIGDAGSGGGGGGGGAAAPPAPSTDKGEGSDEGSPSEPEGEEAAPVLVQAARTGTALLRCKRCRFPAEDKTHTLKIRVVVNDTDQPVEGLKLLITRPAHRDQKEWEEPHTTDPDGRIEIDDLDTGGSIKVRCDLEGARASHTYAYVGKGEKPIPEVREKDREPRGLKEVSAEWRLANVKEHKVKTGDTLHGIASSNGTTWKKLAEFNWGTSEKAKINEYLRDYVGCTKTTNGETYKFDDSDKPGIIYVPKEWSTSLEAYETKEPMTEEHAIKEHTIRVRELTRMLMHMYLDANRDGDVDKVRSALNKEWEWGKDKKGAVVLVNNDDDDSSKKPDHDDDKVNSKDDVDDLAPLEFKRFGPSKPPSGWKAELRVSDKTKIRIFDARSDGANVIIGPDKGDTYDFKNDLSPKEWNFGMEATQYAHKAYKDREKKDHKAFNGTIRLTLKLTSPEGKTYEEWAEVRVAPWMMPNHLDKAEEVHVVKRPYDKHSPIFTAALKPLVKKATGKDPAEHVEFDRWMQDCMEIGYSSLPKHAIHAVMRAARDKHLKDYPKKLLKGEFGYHEKGDLSAGTTFDSHGNLEVTPPCTSADGKKEYPWGRIYFGGHGLPGETFDPEVRAFLEAQIVQKPIDVDTSWLSIGHVDEIISFVPGGPKGFTMLLASPNRAYEIVEQYVVSHGMTNKLLMERMLNGRLVETTIFDFRYGDKLALGHTADELWEFNNGTVGPKLEDIRKQFENELGLDWKDIIKVPVLFWPSPLAPKFADALTAGMVNMLVINKHCIFPKPYGPVVDGEDKFEEDFKSKLSGLGLTPHAIDDWDLYHVYRGEVHCATNTVREAKEAKWWEFKP